MVRTIQLLLPTMLAGWLALFPAPALAHPKWPFKVTFATGVTATDGDVCAITAVVARVRDIDHRILAIQFNSRTEAEVFTGEVRGPEQGGGSIVTVRKQRGHWIADDKTEYWVA